MLIQQTWKKDAGRIQIQYCQQAPNKYKGSHEVYLNPDVFLEFCEALGFMDIDMMIDIRSKNIAVLAVLDLLHMTPFHAQKIWKHYQYLVIRHSIKAYILIEDKYDTLSIIEFYRVIYEVLALVPDRWLAAYRYIFVEWERHVGYRNSIKLRCVLDRFKDCEIPKKVIKRTYSAVASCIDEQDSYLFYK